MSVAAAERKLSDFVAVRVTEDELMKGSSSSVAFCEMCSRTFANVNAFRFHQVKTHNLVRGEEDLALRHRARTASEIERHYFCPVTNCQYNSNRTFRAYKLLRQHYFKVHCEKRLRCDECKIASFSLQRDLIYHKRKRCPAKGSNVRNSKCVPAEAGSTFESEKHQKKSSSKSSNAVQQSEKANINIIVVNGNAIPAAVVVPSFKEILPKPALRSTKAVQTDDVECCKKMDTCHSGSQTAQWNTCELSSPVLHEYNDFHCQTHIASGVEFGTQISPEDVISGGLSAKHNKTGDDDFEFEDIWRHIETQTCTFTGSDALTQTAIDFMDSASMTDWDLLI